MKLSKCCSILCDNTDKIDWKSIFLSQKPLILKQIVYNSEARKKWHDLNYLKSKVIEYGEECLVPVEIGGHYMSKQMQRPHINFIEFIDYLIQLQKQSNDERITNYSKNSNHYNNSKNPNINEISINTSRQDDNNYHYHTYDQAKHLYLAQHDLTEIPPLMNDIIIPEITTTTGKGQNYGNKIWLGSSLGTTSPCHYDPYHNVLCQIVGEKRILLFPYEEEKYLYPLYHMRQKNTSQIDFENYYFIETISTHHNNHNDNNNNDNNNNNSNNSTISSSSSSDDSIVSPGMGQENSNYTTTTNHYHHHHHDNTNQSINNHRNNSNNTNQSINNNDNNDNHHHHHHLEKSYPMTKDLKGMIAELHPGDGLFIPKRYWHHCQSYGLSCSVSFWWL